MRPSDLDEKGWIRRLVDSDGRRRADRIPAILKIIKEIAVIIGIVVLSFGGLDPSMLLRLLGGG